MSAIYEIQNEKVKIYSEILDINKVNNIINILKLFYHKYKDEKNIVEWIDNQILFFLDPYSNKINKFYNNRIKFIKNFNKKVSNCEYENVSLDKIIIELFSWSNKELKAFYKINNSKNTNNSYKSIYNLGLRDKKGGGMSNYYLLKYIKALSNKDNFKKTILFFNNLYKLNELNKYNNFLENYLNINEIYINKNIEYVDIEKLFLYLLSSNKINEINKIFYYFYIKLSIKNKSIKIYNDNKFKFDDKLINKLINNISWICIKYKFDNFITVNFYKIFDNIKIWIYLNISNNYITTYFIVAYNKNYDNLIVLNPYEKKFNYFSSKNKKINKILINAKKDFEKTVSLKLSI